MTGRHAHRAANRLRRTLLLALLVTACSDHADPAGPSGPQPPQGGAAVRIEIAPATVLLTAAGATRQLVAIGYDAEGNETEVDVSWRSSDESVATVAADGTLTARAALGSAQVTAQAGALTTPPVLVLVARPVAGAVLVDDGQVVSGPIPASPDAEYGVGWRSVFRLSGMAAPSPGTILLASGGAPIAGRVVEVTPVGTELDVTIELLPLPELFEQLLVDETIPLDAGDVQLDASFAQEYVLERSVADEIVLTPRGGARAWSASALPAGAGAAAGEFKLGPFTCETSRSIPQLDLPKPKLKFDNKLALQIGYTDRFERLALVGDLGASFEYRPVFKAAFEGAIDCSATPGRVVIPLGALGPAFAVIVPIGIGMKLEGKLTLAEVGFDVSARAGATAVLGVDCPGGGACSPLTTFERKPLEHSFELVAPSSVTGQMQLELGGTGYVLAQLAFGPPAFEALQAEAVEGKVGVKQSVDLKLAHAQVEDGAYASSFDLKAEITLGPGKHLQQALDALGGLLGIDIDVSIDLAESLDPLAESPKGSLTIEPAAVTAGDTSDVATFTVELDPVTYLGLPSIDSVQIVWKKPDASGGFTLEAGPVECSGLTGSSSRTKFECETTFAEEHIGTQTFAAFVYARLFDVPIPVPLEIAMDSIDVQPNVECGMPGEWDLWGFFDDSEVEPGATLTTNLDYLSVSGHAATTSTGGWSPDAYIDAKAVDYIRVIPLVPTANLQTPLYAVTRGTGRATAVVSENNCCGTYGDGRAEIEIRSSWLDYAHPLKAAAGASYSGTLGPSDEQQLDVEGRGWLGDPVDDRWINMEMEIYATVRHRGAGNSATATGELTITVLDVVDRNDVPVPAVICSAAGYNYGTFVGVSGEAVASRPVQQAPVGTR